MPEPPEASGQTETEMSYVIIVAYTKNGSGDRVAERAAIVLGRKEPQNS